MRTLTTIRGLRDSMRAERGFDWGDRLLCHPENYEWLKSELWGLCQGDVVYGMSGVGYIPMGINYGGLEITTSKDIPVRERREWEFPDDPFVDYGDEDLAWAVPLGYGRWTWKGERVFYRVSPSRMVWWNSYSPTYRIPSPLIFTA